MSKSLSTYLSRESAFQEATAKWLRLAHPDLLAFHAPNGGKRPQTMVSRKGVIKPVAAIGALLKRQGVVPGVPDWVILQPSGPYAGLLVELKIANGRLSKEQKSFLAKAEASGYKTAVAYNIEQFIKIVETYLTE